MQISFPCHYHTPLAFISSFNARYLIDSYFLDIYFSLPCQLFNTLPPFMFHSFAPALQLILPLTFHFLFLYSIFPPHSSSNFSDIDIRPPCYAVPVHLTLTFHTYQPIHQSVPNPLICLRNLHHFHHS